jgi:hypothetical protein
MTRTTEAWTTWIAAGVKPGITIEPTKQTVGWRGSAKFKITVTNTGHADLKNGIVESKRHPGATATSTKCRRHLSPLRLLAADHDQGLHQRRDRHVQRRQQVDSLGPGLSDGRA